MKWNHAMKHKQFKYFPTWRFQVLLALALLRVLSPFDLLEAQHKARNEENKKEQALQPYPCYGAFLLPWLPAAPESNRWMGHNSLRRSLIGYLV